MYEAVRHRCVTLHFRLSGSKHKKVVANLTKRTGVACLSPTLSSPLLTSAADLPSSIILVKDPETGESTGGYKCKACDCVLSSVNQLHAVSISYETRILSRRVLSFMKSSMTSLTLRWSRYLWIFFWVLGQWTYRYNIWEFEELISLAWC